MLTRIADKENEINDKKDHFKPCCEAEKNNFKAYPIRYIKNFLVRKIVQG